MTNPDDGPNDGYVHSYLALRRWIGVIGIALPPVLIIGELIIDGPGLLNSISGYYYSGMRDWLVGGLWAVGVFLLFYRGHNKWDDRVASLSGFAAIGVALCPTSPSGGPNVARSEDTTLATWHLIFAGFFFASLAFYCLRIFPRRDNEPGVQKKDARNTVYIACGIAIIVFLVAILVIGKFFDDDMRQLHPILWLEAGAVWAFGIAWLTKGRAMVGLTG